MKESRFFFDYNPDPVERRLGAKSRRVELGLWPQPASQRSVIMTTDRHRRIERQRWPDFTLVEVQIRNHSELPCVHQLWSMRRLYSSPFNMPPDDSPEARLKHVCLGSASIPFLHGRITASEAFWMTDFIDDSDWKWLTAIVPPQESTTAVYSNLDSVICASLGTFLPVHFQWSPV